MKAAFLIQPNTITIKEVPQPLPQKGEVCIRLQKAGICGSDVHLFLGHRLLPQPTIIGHEAIGIVDALGDGVTQLQIGDRVVIEPNIPCGTCRYCNNNRGNICSNKRVVGVTENGCFAEYICLPHNFCWKLPESISNEDAVTIEPAAVAYHALHCSNLQPTDAIAIVGLGAIGLLITQLAINKGNRVYTLDINEANLEAAKAMGAVPLSVKNQTPALLDAIANTLLKNNIAAVFECAGAATTATIALSIVPRGADVVLVGLSAVPASFVPLKIVREGIRIIPSIIYNHPTDFRETIALIEAKKFNPGKIISVSFPLQQIQTAMETAASGTKTKLLIDL
jgi:2-desacetyl-2-hydroxyethyl bacteriochlorophyllide A dehydrogenase